MRIFKIYQKYMQKYLKFYRKCTLAPLMTYFLLNFDDFVAVTD